MNVSVSWGSHRFNLLTRLAFSNNNPATLKDLLEFVYLKVPVGIARLGTGGDQSFLHRELDHERLQVVNSLIPNNGRGLRIPQC